MRGVNSLAKHPERVGTGPKDKKRLQIQLTWQNRPNCCSPVPPLPGAREGRGSDKKRLQIQLTWQNLPNFYYPVPPLPGGPGGPGIARARRDLSNAHYRAQIHAGLSKSMWHPRAERGPGAGRFVRWLGSLPLCVVFRVQADRKDTSHRALGSAAESTL